MLARVFLFFAGYVQDTFLFFGAFTYYIRNGLSNEYDMEVLKKSDIHYNLELSGRPNRFDLYTIFLRISTKGRGNRFRLSTNVKIDKKSFNPSANYGSWVKKEVNKTAINERLREFIAEKKEQCEKHLEKGKIFTIERLKHDLLNNQNISSESFISYFEKCTSSAKFALLGLHFKIESALS